MPSNLKSGSGLAALVCMAIGSMTCGASAVTLEVAKKCEELTMKEYPFREPGNPAAGLKRGTTREADRYHRECLEKGGNVDPQPESPAPSGTPR